MRPLIGTLSTDDKHMNEEFSRINNWQIVSIVIKLKKPTLLNFVFNFISSVIDKESLDNLMTVTGQLCRNNI